MCLHDSCIGRPAPTLVVGWWVGRSRPKVSADRHRNLLGLSSVALTHRFGGQFAFVEVINSMQTPSHFPRVVGLSTLLMGCAFAGIGAIGYW